MRRNVAGQFVGAQMITAADGTAFTGSVTVYVTGNAGTQAVGSVGSGACTHEGNGFHTYAPAQAETNYTHVAFTFIGTGAIPATVQIYPTAYDANGRADLGAISGSAVSTSSAQLGVNVVNAAGTAWGSGAITAASIASNAITAAKIATDAITAAKIAADAIGASELAADAATEIATAVWAAATRVLTANTNLNDPTAAAIADAVWDEVMSGHSTAGSTGAEIQSHVTLAELSAVLALTAPMQLASTTIGTVNSQTNFTLSGGPDVDDILNGSMIIITSVADSDNKYPVEITDFVGATRTVTIAAAPPFTIVGSEAVTVWGNIDTGPTAAEINAEIVDALSTDTYGEPTGVPGATVSLAEKIGRLYMALRNQVTVTATKKTYYDDGGSAEWEKDLSDDGTTYTESEGNAI